jgi:hypothetical protein
VSVGTPAERIAPASVATLRVVGGHQVDPIAVRASHPRSMLDARIEGLRVGRLTQIKSLSADVNDNNDLVVASCNITANECAGNGGGAKEKPGAQANCFGVHIKLPVNPC